jgi:hypothetical protein
MRKALIAGVLAVALGSAAPASAGCWATVALAPPPADAAAGEVWTARITILQHGRNPLPDAATAKPTLTIVNRTTGQRQTFAARASDPTGGRYEARVVFPSAGSWRYEIFDGFTSWNGEPAPCGANHKFAAVQIGAPGAGPSDGVEATQATSTFPVWPLAGGIGTLLAAGAALAYFGRRRGSRSPAAPT